MKNLIKKELTILLCSPVGIFFLLAFLLSAGAVNWVFLGSFNILDNSYASLTNFFKLAPILFIVLIPALTMRSFSQEKSNGMLDVFRSRPIGMSALYFSKLFSSWLVVLLALLSTSAYVYTLFMLSSPVGNIDLNEIVASYISLSLFSLVFISVGLFASSLTSNQLVAFIVGISFNFFLFYGFDLLASLFTGTKIQLAISSMGLLHQSHLMDKGVLEISDLLLSISYVIIFTSLSIYFLSFKTKKANLTLLSIFASVVLLNTILSFSPSIRFDFTSDKRYTISDQSKKMLRKLPSQKANTRVKIYLDGELNAGFQRLQDAIGDLLTDFKHESENHIVYEFVNPYSLKNTAKEVHTFMADQNMGGIALNEVDREGKVSQKIVYPYAQVFADGDTLLVSFLKNIGGYSAEENLNASIENLEFQFVDAIRLLQKNGSRSIAFIEGHDEIARVYVYDAEELLSKYFSVNRGQIGHEVGVLDEFEVVIIAGATKQFTEREKFVLDQYIMSGGRVLWMIDGVYLSQEELEKNSQSPSMKNDTNLDDLLFAYGVRINPVLIQDVQSTSIYITSGEADATANQYVKIPWYYSALLLPSIDHPITKDISLVKANFASSIDILDKSNVANKTVLLTTSAHANVVKVPEMISFDFSHIESKEAYFNQSFLPVAVALEGNFNSAFQNRSIPDSVSMNDRQFKSSTEGSSTKMLVVSSSDIIRNELVGRDEQTQVLPMGFDKVSERQYGNRDFVVNAVNWLANDDEWLSLRSKEQKIRLLNKEAVYRDRNFFVAINLILPLVFSTICVAGFYLYRKRKYEK